MKPIDRFNHARYGLFIHWGAYSAAGRGEWVMNRERISKDEYTEKYINNWHAENYQPKEWAQLAVDSGMKYAVLTSRHHDGFALWPTKATDFNAGLLGPKKDLIAPYVEAMRSAGLMVGLYYSPASWTYPDYPGAFYRDWPGESDWKDEASRQRFIAYYRQELTELCTNYGKIDILWYDGCIPENIDGAETNKMIRKLQPDILLNPRLDLASADFTVCEQAIRPPKDPQQSWEACMTMLSATWGCHFGDKIIKTPRQVLEMLIATGSKGGNLLLNVGPNPDGTIRADEAEVLRKVGKWLKSSGEWLYNSGRHEYPWNNSCWLSIKGTKVYLHFYNDPQGSFCWAECGNRVLSAKILATGQEISFQQTADRLFLENLPNPLIQDDVTTIVLEVEGQPQPLAKQTTFWIPG